MTIKLRHKWKIALDSKTNNFPDLLLSFGQTIGCVITYLAPSLPNAIRVCGRETENTLGIGIPDLFVDVVTPAKISSRKTAMAIGLENRISEMVAVARAQIIHFFIPLLK